MFIKLLAAFIIFLVATKFIHIDIPSETADTILAISTFTFAIYLGFAVANRNSRISVIQMSLRRNDVHLVNLYHFSKGLGEKVTRTIQKSIDRYLTRQFDYKLKDIEMTMPELVMLRNTVIALKPTNTKQTELYSRMLFHIEEITLNHKEIIRNMRDTLMWYQWGVLYLLAAVIWMSLIYINDGTTFSTIFISFLSVAILLLILILHSLDNVTWLERVWIWKPIKELFLELDL